MENPMPSLSSAALSALAACLVIAPGLASAADLAPTRADASPSITVRYTDLNLATEAGTTALYARLVAAARHVCTVSDIRNLRQVAAAEACQQQAIANAVRDVHNPKLAAVYSAHLRHG
jgi:UrcA family protein